MSAELVAFLMLEPGRPAPAAHLVARCGVQNISSGPVEINLAALSSPSLALEITDAVGEPVLLPPPPVPPAETPTAMLQSGQRHNVDYRGFVPAWTPPGRYRVRCRYVAGDTVARSEWVGFELLT